VLHLLRFARHATLAAVLFALLVGSAACGGGDHHDDWEGGTLQVINDPQSFWTLETVGISAFGGPVELFDVFLWPGEDAFIDLFPDTYDVEFWWEDGFYEYAGTVDIWDDEVTPIYGYNVNVYP
jgi:hypothetical protein